MRKLLVILGVTFFLGGNADAGDNQAARIEELERENERLSYRVSELQDQLNRYQRRHSGTYRQKTATRYQGRPLQSTNQTLRDLAETQRTLKQLGR